MKLKLQYNHDAPKREWAAVEQVCSECDGKGVVINETNDGVVECPKCKGKKIVTVKVPPVSGVEIQTCGPVQRFSPRLVDRGRREGWIDQEGINLIINGINGSLTYQVERFPGRYDDETVHAYDCILVKEDMKNG